MVIVHVSKINRIRVYHNPAVPLCKGQLNWTNFACFYLGANCLLWGKNDYMDQYHGTA